MFMFCDSRVIFVEYHGIKEGGRREMVRSDFYRNMIHLMIVVVIIFLPTVARAVPPVSVDRNGIALGGYDPVAYFTMGRAVKGSQVYQYEWMGARWLFSKEEHRELFMNDPKKYAPQYGGY
jgi:YHS domain-containing protein